MADEKREREELSYYYTLAQTGVEIVVPIVAGVILDRQFNTTPWCTVAGAVIGPTAAIAHAIRTMNKFEARRRERQQQKDPE